MFRGWASFFGWSQYELGYRNTLMSQSFVPRVVSAGLGSVLLWAGTAKLLDMNAFVGVVGEFGLVWEPLLPTVAWCVVVGELVLGWGCGWAVAGRAWALADLWRCFFACWDTEYYWAWTSNVVVSGPAIRAAV